MKNRSYPKKTVLLASLLLGMINTLAIHAQETPSIDKKTKGKPTLKVVVTHDQLVKAGIDALNVQDYLDRKAINRVQTTVNTWSKGPRRFFVTEEKDEEGSRTVGLKKTCQKVTGEVTDSGELMLEVFAAKNRRGCRSSESLLLGTSSRLVDGGTICKDGIASALSDMRHVDYGLVSATENGAQFSAVRPAPVGCKVEAWNVTCPDETKTFCEIEQVRPLPNSGPNYFSAFSPKPRPVSGTCQAICQASRCAPALADVKAATDGIHFDKLAPGLGVFTSKKACKAWVKKRRPVIKRRNAEFAKDNPDL